MARSPRTSRPLAGRSRVLRALCVTATLLAALVALPQESHAAARGPDARPAAKSQPHAVAKPQVVCQAIFSYFLERYYENPAGWGCATDIPRNYGNGVYQAFVGGEMDWSPSQGINMVVSGLRTSNIADGIYFESGPSDGWNYDAWLVRITHDDRLIAQAECRAGFNNGAVWCNRTRQGGPIGYDGPGHYQIVTEGCDVSWTGSHTCTQGWTIPVDIWL